MAIAELNQQKTKEIGRFMKNWRLYLERVMGLYHPFIVEVNKILHEEKSSRVAVFALKTLIYDLEAKMLRAHEEFLSRNVFYVSRVKKMPVKQVTGYAGSIRYSYNLN